MVALMLVGKSTVGVLDAGGPWSGLLHFLEVKQVHGAGQGSFLTLAV